MVKIAYVLGAAFLLASLLSPAVSLAQVDQADQLQLLLAQAKQAQARSDFSSAAAAYREAVKLSKDTPELWANLGLMDYQTGNHAEAVKSLTEALRLKSSLFVANLFLGLDYIETKQPATALPFLKRAKELNPRDAQGPLGLGHAYSALQQPRLATQEFHRAAEIDPLSLPAWFGLGISNMEVVEADARKLSAGSSTSPYLLALFAESLASQQKYVQAIDQYKRASEKSNGPLCSHAALGFLYVRQHALTEARNEFGINPNGTHNKTDEGCSLARLGVARIESESGSNTTSLEIMSDLWKRDRGFVRQNLAEFFDGLTRQQLDDFHSTLLKAHATGKLPSALNDLLEDQMSDSPHGLIENADVAGSPDTVAGKTENPELLFSQGHYGECTAKLKARFSTLGAEDLQLLANCSFFTGDFETTAIASDRMLERSPSNPVALYWAIKASQRLAVNALTHVSQIDPNSPKTHILLGDIYRKREHYSQARDEYQKTLRLAPNDSAALLGLTATYLMTSQVVEAVATGLHLLQQNGSDPEANLLVAECYVSQRDYTKAEPLLQKSLNVKPELQPRVHVLLGTIYAADERNEQAVAEFKQGLQSDEDGSVHYKISRVYRKLGDYTSADAALRSVKELQEARLKRASTAIQDSLPESSSDHHE